MEEPAVVLARGGRVAEIILNRPDKLSAMDLRRMLDLVAALEAVAADPSDIVVVRGAGRATSAS